MPVQVEHQHHHHHHHHRPHIWYHHDPDPNHGDAPVFPSSMRNDEMYGNSNHDQVVHDERRRYVLNRSMNGLRFPSLSSGGSSSSPASLNNVPHLRHHHHHHHSRNNGLNASTSPFHRLTQSAKETMLNFSNSSSGSSSSASSESSGNSSMGRSLSTSSELKYGRGISGESDTFSEKSVTKLLSSSSSSSSSSSPDSSSQLFLSPSSPQTVWSSSGRMKVDNMSSVGVGGNVTSPENSHYRNYDHHTSHNHHYDFEMGHLENSTNVVVDASTASPSSSSSSALEQFVTKSVRSVNGARISESNEGFKKSLLADFSPIQTLNGNSSSSSNSGSLQFSNSVLNLTSSSSSEEMIMGGFQIDETNGSTENYYFENSSFLNNITLISNGSVSESVVNKREELYKIIVPVMILFCLLAILVNLIIVISARWCRKPMSPTLYFSISLALADAYAALFLATGLFINSFMPTVLNIRWSACVSLVIEAFRQGGILVIVCHLLSLAMNHWIGIVRPLHYAATMTRRTAWTIIIFCWICPITVIFIYYSSVSGEGFQSASCRNYDFLMERTYRAFFASCFFAPLILMSFIYIHIFIIVRNHHTHRQRYQSTQQLKRNVKAVLTTMLVLGTYIIGWMPATVMSLIACKNCKYNQSSFPDTVRYAINISINLLVILKTLVDPVIYAARMSDIQMALKKMRYDIMIIFCKSCAPPEPPNERGYYLNSPSARTSFYDTKSMRMSSFGSRSSSRRNPGGGASVANAGTLLLQANGSQIHHQPQHHHLHHNHNNIPNVNKNGGSGGTNGYVSCGNNVPPASGGGTQGRPHPNGTPSNNGSGRRAVGQCNQPQLMINSKSAFEMSEIN